MTDTPNFTADGKMELTASEHKIMQQLLDAHDRGGFYMVYEAMTDSTEAGLQSRISTFSGNVGGAALEITVTVHLSQHLRNCGDSALYSSIFAPRNIQANLTHTALS